MKNTLSEVHSSIFGISILSEIEMKISKETQISAGNLFQVVVSVQRNLLHLMILSVKSLR